MPLDDLEYPASDKDYPLDEATPDASEKHFALGFGKYRIESGLRFPGGTSFVRTSEFTLSSEIPSLKLLCLIAPPADLPQTALVERDLGDFSDSARLSHSGRYVFFVGDGGEPSLRELDALKGMESMNRLLGLNR